MPMSDQQSMNQQMGRAGGKPAIVKKIGNTTYKVMIRFSNTSQEMVAMRSSALFWMIAEKIFKNTLRKCFKKDVFLNTEQQRYVIGDYVRELLKSQMERILFVIDSRRPMIITSNLKLGELKNSSDLDHVYIYDPSGNGALRSSLT